MVVVAANDHVDGVAELVPALIHVVESSDIIVVDFVVLGTDVGTVAAGSDFAVVVDVVGSHGKAGVVTGADAVAVIPLNVVVVDHPTGSAAGRTNRPSLVSSSCLFDG